MLNDEINKYKDLYAQLVSEIAGLHNATLTFTKTIGRDIGFTSRKHLREIERISKEMKRQGQIVYKENIAQIRLDKKLAKEQKKVKKNGKRNNSN